MNIRFAIAYAIIALLVGAALVGLFLLRRQWEENRRIMRGQRPRRRS
jgi:uncharacterized protein YneF (UPF0154 family)